MKLKLELGRLELVAETEMERSLVDDWSRRICRTRPMTYIDGTGVTSITFGLSVDFGEIRPEGEEVKP